MSSRRKVFECVEDAVETFLVMLFVFCVCGFMFSCSKINAQTPCANGRCPVPARVVNVVGGPVGVTVSLSGWYVVEGRPAGEWSLYVNGVSVGTYNEDTGRYVASDGRQWLFKNACSKAVNPVEFGQIPANGIDAMKLRPDESAKEKFRSNAGEISKADAVKLLGAPGLRDDSGLLRVTVIGPESERIKVISDLKNDTELALFASEILVKDYAPNHWAVANNGFISSGKPTIYIQSGAGKVLHRQDEYDGAGPLAGAIRKAKKYDPAKDVDLRKEPVIAPPVAPTPVVPTPSPVEPIKPTDTPLTPATPTVVVSPWLALVAVLMTFLFARRK